MLKDDTRRRLKEHGWLEIAKKHSNPHLALNRLRDQGVEAIKDLTLLAQTLPSNTLKDIFNYENVDELMESILTGTTTVDPVYKFMTTERFTTESVNNPWKTHLASLLVSEGIHYCMQQYKSEIEKDSILNEPVMSQLQKSKEICDQIAFKMRSSQIQSIERKENLVYLFNWAKIRPCFGMTAHEVQGEDTCKFLDFCNNEILKTTEPAPIEIVHRISDNGYRTEFEFIDWWRRHVGGSLDIDVESKTADLSNPPDFRVKNTANFTVQRDGKVILSKTLIVRAQDNNVYVYKEKENEIIRQGR
ncbi:MAG: hypothetical protein M3P08_07915 [Thermoproteota archaeon]|nr:hypothetical protein [Thermoproteota archaeon]